jgi:hypothetical protein
MFGIVLQGARGAAGSNATYVLMSKTRERSASAILENQKRKENAALSDFTVKGGVS